MPPPPRKDSRPRRFAYYDRLSTEEKRAYRRSDAVTEVPLQRPEAIAPLVPPLRAALETGERAQVQRATVALARAIFADLGVGNAEVEVLATRPRGDYGELHGLYTYDPDAPPKIQVWMRTAAKAKVVAWKTYLRTLLHEVGHHLDLHYFDFSETFHTQGFYSRENHLFHQLAHLAPAGPAVAPPSGPAPAPAPPRRGRKPAAPPEVAQAPLPLASALPAAPDPDPGENEKKDDLGRPKGRGRQLTIPGI